jgi:hypothetical protein
VRIYHSGNRTTDNRQTQTKTDNRQTHRENENPHSLSGTTTTQTRFSFFKTPLLLPKQEAANKKRRDTDRKKVATQTNREKNKLPNNINASTTPSDDNAYSSYY